MIAKLASTAMTRFLRKLDEPTFVQKAEQFVGLMREGRIPKREMFIKSLGKGGSQQSDLVIHPNFGPSVRKYFHRSAYTPEAFKVQNQFLRYVTKKYPKSFAALKGFEREGTPQQKSYFEYIVGKNPRGDVNIPKRQKWYKKLDKLYEKTYKEGDGLKEKDKLKINWYPRIQKLDRLRTENKIKIQQGRLAPIIPKALKQDMDRLESKYKLHDVAIDNIKGEKIIDAEPAQSYFPSVFKYRTISKENKPVLKNVLGHHEYDSSPSSSKIKAFSVASGIGLAGIGAGIGYHQLTKKKKRVA